MADNNLVGSNGFNISDEGLGILPGIAEALQTDSVLDITLEGEVALWQTLLWGCGDYSQPKGLPNTLPGLVVTTPIVDEKIPEELAPGETMRAVSRAFQGLVRPGEPFLRWLVIPIATTVPDREPDSDNMVLGAASVSKPRGRWSVFFIDFQRRWTWYAGLRHGKKDGIARWTQDYNVLNRIKLPNPPPACSLTTEFAKKTEKVTGYRELYTPDENVLGHLADCNMLANNASFSYAISFVRQSVLGIKAREISTPWGLTDGDAIMRDEWLENRALLLHGVSRLLRQIDPKSQAGKAPSENIAKIAKRLEEEDIPAIIEAANVCKNGPRQRDKELVEADMEHLKREDDDPVIDQVKGAIMDLEMALDWEDKKSGNDGGGGGKGQAKEAEPVLLTQPPGKGFPMGEFLPFILYPVHNQHYVHRCVQITLDEKNPKITRFVEPVIGGEERARHLAQALLPPDDDGIFKGVLDGEAIETILVPVLIEYKDKDATPEVHGCLLLYDVKKHFTRFYCTFGGGKRFERDVTQLMSKMNFQGLSEDLTLRQVSQKKDELVWNKAQSDPKDRQSHPMYCLVHYIRSTLLDPASKPTPYDWSAESALYGLSALYFGLKNLLMHAEPADNKADDNKDVDDNPYIVRRSARLEQSERDFFKLPVDLWLYQAGVSPPSWPQYVPKAGGERKASTAAGLAVEKKRNAFHTAFPHGFDRRNVSGEGLLCGVRAVLRSMELQFPDVPRPTEKVLTKYVQDASMRVEDEAGKDRRGNPKRGSKNYFSVDELSAGLNKWGLANGDLELIVGAWRHEGGAPLVPHSATSETNDETILVWIYHIHGEIGHYNGLERRRAPKAQEAGKQADGQRKQSSDAQTAGKTSVRRKSQTPAAAPAKRAAPDEPAAPEAKRKRADKELEPDAGGLFLPKKPQKKPDNMTDADKDAYLHLMIDHDAQKVLVGLGPEDPSTTANSRFGDGGRVEFDIGFHMIIDKTGEVAASTS